MKKQFQLDIPQPCHEDWNKMTPEGKGRHCASCEKIVVDFTTMTQKELIEFFQNPPQKVCGRFQKEQLRTYTLPTHGFHVGWRPMAAVLGLGLATSIVLPSYGQSFPDNPTPISGPTYSESSLQTRTTHRSNSIRGQIIERESYDVLPGVNVILADYGEGVITDLDGNFSLTVPHDWNGAALKIRVSFIGFESQTITVSPEEIRNGQLKDRIVLGYDDEMILTGEVILGRVSPYESSQDNWGKRSWNFLRYRVFGWL